MSARLTAIIIPEDREQAKQFFKNALLENEGTRGLARFWNLDKKNLYILVKRYLSPEERDEIRKEIARRKAETKEKELSSLKEIMLKEIRKGGTMIEVTERLGVNRMTFYWRLRKMGITADDLKNVKNEEKNKFRLIVPFPK